MPKALKECVFVGQKKDPAAQKHVPQGPWSSVVVNDTERALHKS